MLRIPNRINNYDFETELKVAWKFGWNWKRQIRTYLSILFNYKFVLKRMAAVKTTEDELKKGTTENGEEEEVDDIEEGESKDPAKKKKKKKKKKKTG